MGQVEGVEALQGVARAVVVPVVAASGMGARVVEEEARAAEECAAVMRKHPELRNRHNQCPSHKSSTQRLDHRHRIRH